MKRKRGRPRKVHSIFYGTNMPVMPGSGVQGMNMPVMPDSGVQRTNMPVMLNSAVQRTNVPVIPSNKNSYPNVGTADGCDDGMVGKKVTCVIEGTFNGGYLLNVQVAPDTHLRGVVFRPERVVPVTPASDVAPQVKMIQRTEIPIPDLNQESQIRSSAPSSGQCNKQPFVAKLPVPMSEDPVLPAEVQSGISVSPENQSAPVVAPLVDLPKIDSSISAGGIMPKIMSKPRPERAETLIPVLNPESQIHSSVPSLGQCNKQPFEVELPLPMTVDPVIPTKLYFGSVSLENQSALVVEPLTVVPKIVSSISAGGLMPTGMSNPGPESLSSSIMSEFEGDKTIKQDETLHDVDAPRQAKESNTDGGATADSQKTSEPINLIPTVENNEKDFTTGQQSMPSVYNLNELIPDEPKHSTIEINQNPESAEHESIPSEHINNTVDNFVQMQGSLKTGPESQPASIMSDKTVKHEEKLHEVDVSRQAKQSSADGGARKDSQQTSEAINLVPTVENTEMELTTGQKSIPFAYNLNELIPDEPKCSITEMQFPPETDTQEDAKSKPVTETITKVDTANSNGTPSTGIANIPDEGSNHAVEFSHPPILYDKEHVSSESKPLSKASGFQEISDPQYYSLSGAVKNVDGNQPT